MQLTFKLLEVRRALLPRLMTSLQKLSQPLARGALQRLTAMLHCHGATSSRVRGYSWSNPDSPQRVALCQTPSSLLRPLSVSEMHPYIISWGLSRWRMPEFVY
jgi:hypothetical protein